MIVLDISRSMDFGSDGITKLDYARYLAASLAYLSDGQRDRVGLITFDNDVVDHVRPGPRQFEVVLRTIDRIRPGGPVSMSAPLSRVAESFRRKSIVLLISDFYEEPRDAVRAVNMLRQRGNDLIAFQVLDPAELNRLARKPQEPMGAQAGARANCHSDVSSSEEAEILQIQGIDSDEVKPAPQSPPV